MTPYSDIPWKTIFTYGMIASEELDFNVLTGSNVRFSTLQMGHHVVEGRVTEADAEFFLIDNGVEVWRYEWFYVTQLDVQ